MEARPELKDFELDYNKYPVRQVGGIKDMEYLNRKQDQQERFNKAYEEWVLALQRKVEEFMDNLELHISLNEDDWYRNPVAMFNDFKKEQALKQ